MAMMASFRSQHALAVSLTGVGMVGLLSLPALAGEIRATPGPEGLGTLVNGSPSEACGSGFCGISGGTRAGLNLFHRLDRFQADGAISEVSVFTGGARSVILGVIDRGGTLLDTRLFLSGSADLFVLSPGGLTVGRGASFHNVGALNLSTATGLRLGGPSPGQLFDVLRTDQATASGLSGTPVPGSAGLVTDPATLAGLRLAVNGDLELQEGLLTVDSSLLLDSQGGHLLLNGARIEAPGGSVDLAGAQVTVDATSAVTVDGAGGGNGGSLAITAGREAVLAGTLSARGGPTGGNGGSVRTVSGGVLKLDTTPSFQALDASSGTAGSWWVQAAAIDILPASPTPAPGVSVLDPIRIQQALAGGGSMTVASDGPLAVRSFIRNRASAASSLQLRAGSQLRVDTLLAVFNTATAPFDLDLRHGPGSQVLWSRGDVSLGSEGRLTVGPDTGSGSPGRLVLADSGPVRSVAFRNGQVTTGSLSWEPNSSTNLQLEDGTRFTVTNVLDQRPGNRITGTSNTLLTVAGQGSIENGRLIAAPGADDPATAPRLRVGPGAQLSAHDVRFEGFGLDVADGGRLSLSGTQTLVRPLSIDTAGQVADASFAGGAVGARFDTTLAPLSLRNRSTGLVQVNRRIDLGAHSSLDNQGRITLANGATLAAGTLTTTPASQIDLQGDGSARLALRQRELRNEGRIAGAGTVQLDSGASGPAAGRLVNAGSILPGGASAIGTLTVEAAVELTPSSQLAFSLAGPLAGFGYDSLRVAGDVTLGGAVRYGLSSGFQPPDGTRFDLITSTGTLSGSFASITDTSSGAAVALVPSTTPTTFRLTATAPPTPPTPPPRPTPTPSPSPKVTTPPPRRPAEEPFLFVDAVNTVIFPGVQTSPGAVPGANLGSGGGSELTVSLGQAMMSSDAGTGEAPGTIGFGVGGLNGAQLATALTEGDRNRTDDLTRSIDGLSAPPGAPESLAVEELQRLLKEAEQASRSTAHPFVPAVLSLSFTRKPPGMAGSEGDSFLDLSLIMPSGDPVGRRVDLSRLALQEELRRLYGQLARQDPLGEQDPASPARRLHDILIGPVLPALERNGINSVLIVADRGLQAVPFAALHDGRQWFGERFGFSLTPSLRLTSLAPPGRSRGRVLAVGASQFNRLAPLPLVPDELAGIPKRDGVDLYLNDQFTPQVLLAQAGDPRYDRVHVATHAEFRPGGASQARIYTGNDTLALKDFVRLRRVRGNNPLELVALSACRTALGDSDSELGFAGLALIAGSRSAIGTLWYVDDVATSAYFLQLYRFLDQGLPKAEALRATREAMAKGRLRLVGDAVLATDGTPLLTRLTPSQQRRVAGGMGHPYFWAGVELLGTPW